MMPDGNAPEVPAIRFAPARGARLAWQRFGSGPDVVAIPPTAQNIETAWEWPRIRDMLHHFGSFCTWTQFDKRGTGASDRRSTTPGIDERVEDLRAVMDHAEIEQATLYGASEGGPTCVLFAATYPERVNGLVLHGTGPFTSPQGLTGPERDALSEDIAVYASRWGTEESAMVTGFAPSIADDPGYITWHQRYERLAATQDSLLELLLISLDVDVSDVLQEVDAPTLVLHATHDRIIPVEWGRLLAQGIENAEMCEYDSPDHFAYADLKWVDHLERFVTGQVAQRPAPQRRGVAHIQTLGRFCVVVDGVEVPNSAWGSRRSRQLCKRLVAARGWPVRRDELADLLWPDENDPQRLGPRLSVQLSAVRRVLGGGVIADRQTVALDLEQVTTDLEVFMNEGDPRRILDLYEGDFLPGDLDEPWTAGPRDEARARFGDTAHDRLLSPTRQDETLARRLITLDRWDERAHRALIGLLLDADLIGDARRAHSAYHDAMREIDISVDSLEDIVASR